MDSIVKTYDGASPAEKKAVESKLPFIELAAPKSGTEKADDEDIISYLHHRNLPKIKEDFNRAGEKGLSME